MNHDEPEIDESQLSPAQREEMHRKLFNWKWAVFWGILVVLIAVCIIVIVLL